MTPSLELIALFKRLNQSKFRSSIALNDKDYSYLKLKGESIITQHAAEFIRQRLTYPTQLMMVNKPHGKGIPYSPPNMRRLLVAGAA